MTKFLSGPITAAALRILCYCLLVAGSTYVLVMETKVVDQAIMFKEFTMTELLQPVYLASCMVLFMLAAKTNPSRLPLAILLAGLAMIAAIRELDHFFDLYIFDGAWQAAALLAAVVTGSLLFRFKSNLIPSIREFTANASFGFMASAFVTLFVFSRIFGMNSLWRAVMNENYLRSVKNLAEEGTELFGYTLLLIAAIEFFRESRIKAQSKAPG
jgi:hypothetical protein